MLYNILSQCMHESFLYCSPPFATFKEIKNPTSESASLSRQTFFTLAMQLRKGKAEICFRYNVYDDYLVEMAVECSGSTATYSKTDEASSSLIQVQR